MQLCLILYTSNTTHNVILNLISLFAHIGFNPIEQHHILTIFNYVNNIGEKVRNNSTTGEQNNVITLYAIYN